jgi:hypothetical protein
LTRGLEPPAARPRGEARPRRGLWLRLAVALAIAIGAYRGALIVAMAPWGTPAPGSARLAAVNRPAAGAIHVHSSFSHDGGGSIEEIREAARASGLGFVFVTDHNDLRAAPSATAAWPAVVVGEEVSTTGGHLLALGVSDEVRAMGPAEGIGVREAVAAIHRQGGWAAVAHPLHRKAGWDRTAREEIDAIEVYNADNDWRDESWLDLLGSLLTYPVAPVRSLALLLDRPDGELALWDSLLAERDVVGIGACDAHARLDLPLGRRLAFPSYWAAFNVVTTEVWPWWPDVAADSTERMRIDPAQSLEGALRAGRASVIFRALGSGQGFYFHYRRGTEITGAGGRGEVAAPRRGRLVVLAPGGHRTIIRIYKDGRPWRESPGPVTEERVTEPGVYRCEVNQLRRLPPLYKEKEFPWIISNPIRIEAAPAHSIEDSAGVRHDRDEQGA